MFQKLFNPENPLMITMTQITDCIFLSLFWLLGCVPVVTTGAAGAALYDAAFRGYRQGEKHTWHRFYRVFRRNLKPGLLPSVVFAGVFWAAARGMIFLWNGAVLGQLSWMLFSAGAVVGILLLGILSVLFPMLSRFENSFSMLLKNTLLLSLANLPRTLALGMLSAGCGYVCIRFVFPLFFVPALSALIGSFLIEPMFRPYMDSPDESAAC